MMKTYYADNVVKTFGELMDDALLVVDVNSTIIEINPACVRLLGETLIGTQLKNRLVYKPLLSDLATCLQSNESMEFTASTKINEFRQMRGRMASYKNDTIIILLMDMTLQHNVEK